MGKQIKVFKERDFGELIGDSLTFFFQEIKLFTKTLLYIIGPFILLTAILSLIFNINTGKSFLQLFETFNGNINLLSQYVNPLVIFLIVLILIFQNVMVYVVGGVYVKLYAKMGKGNFEISDIWDEVKHKYWYVLGGQLLAIIIIIGSAFFFLIPAIYFAVVLFIVFPIIIFEKIGIGSAISRAFKLMSGNWWKSFGALIVLGLLIGFLSKSFSRIMTLVFVAGTNSIISALYTVIVGFASVIFSSILVFLAIFLYASFVYDKENPTLFERIKNISNNESEKEENDFNNENTDKTWENLINEKQNSTQNIKEEETPPPLTEQEKNRFAEEDDNNRFKPKY